MPVHKRVLSPSLEIPRTGEEFMETLEKMTLPLYLAGAGAFAAALTVSGLWLSEGVTKHPWHFWVAPALLASFIGLVFQLTLAYYLKVARPRIKGR